MFGPVALEPLVCTDKNALSMATAAFRVYFAIAFATSTTRSIALVLGTLAHGAEVSQINKGAIPATLAIIGYNLAEVLDLGVGALKLPAVYERGNGLHRLEKKAAWLEGSMVQGAKCLIAHGTGRAILGSVHRNIGIEASPGISLKIVETITMREIELRQQVLPIRRKFLTSPEHKLQILV
jgi:hypothetical protein